MLEVGMVPKQYRKFLDQKKAGSSRNLEEYRHFREEPSMSILKKIRTKLTKIIKDDSEDDDEALGRWSKMLVISTTNAYFQAFKIIFIILCFTSAFDYVYLAAFLTTMENSKAYNVKEVLYELFFFSNMIVNFFTEFHYPSSAKVERNLQEISRIYLSNRFPQDLFVIIPWFHIFKGVISHRYLRLAYMIKLDRLLIGFEQLDRKSYIK